MRKPKIVKHKAIESAKGAISQDKYQNKVVEESAYWVWLGSSSYHVSWWD